MKNIFFKQFRFNRIVGNLFIFVLILQSCQPEENFPTPKSATIITEAVTAITGTSATSGGQISSDGGFKISTQGVCWDTIQNPTIGKSFSIDTSGKSEFTSELSGLSGGTTYYVRAYSTNVGGITYGNEEVFTTNVVPLMTTTEVTQITGNSAKSGGFITETFGAQITDRGICWSIKINPSVSDQKVSLGAGENSFEATMINLKSGTPYHVRSYAITSEGDVSYGKDILFETQLIDYDGNVYTTVQIGEQVWMVQNFISTHYNDGTAINTAEYAWHSGDINQEYGLNYRWTATDNPNFAPEGWHVPTTDEWVALFEYVDGEVNKLKESGTDHWNSDNGTNETGFTALGSGHIYGQPLKTETTWWSSTIDSGSGNPYRWAMNDNGEFYGGPWNGTGFIFSVRLIKD